MRHRKQSLQIGLSALLMTCLASSCADQLEADPGPELAADPSGEVPSGHILSSAQGGGVTFTTVDATDYEAWIYLSFEEGGEVLPDEPSNNDSWDIAFQRFKVKSNGGVSGNGGAEVAVVETPFDDLTEAPVNGWLVDREDSGDDDTDPDYTFLAPTPWYDYDPVAHTLSPKALTYVVHATDGNYYKLEFADYYDAAGTSGFPAFRWAAVLGPAEAPSNPRAPNGLQVDASSTDSWQYVNVTSGTLVTVGSPDDSTEWDLAFKGVQIRSNGGTSGSGAGGAQVAAEQSWEDISVSPSVGFELDTMVPVPGPPGSGEFSGNPVLNDWFDYDMATHTATPKDVIYFVRSAQGAYAKLKIAAYSEGIFTLNIAPVGLQVDVQTTVLDVSQPDDLVYFRFDTGAEVFPEDPATDTTWDVALSGITFQTNSGTSGSGLGGAQEPGVAALTEITAVDGGNGCYLIAGGHVCDCELSQDDCAQESGIWTDQCGCASSFAVDEMIPLPGPPGAGEFSGSPVLNSWYDYDMTTHTVSPRATAFVLKTAAGDYVKLQIISYTSDVFSIDWAYAGPGRTSF